MRNGCSRNAVLIISLVTLGLLIWLTVSVSSNSTQSFDLWLRENVHRFASPTATLAAEVITTTGSILFVSVAFVAATVALLLAHLRREAMRLCSVMAGAVGLENGLKYGIHRARPEAFFGTDPTTYSFPSGHSLFSFCFYFAVVTIFAHRLRGGVGRLGLWVGTALLVAAIGLSRVYLGVHYPTDVLGGFLTAGFWIMLVIAGEWTWWPSCAPARPQTLHQRAVHDPARLHPRR